MSFMYVSSHVFGFLSMNSLECQNVPSSHQPNSDTDSRTSKLWCCKLISLRDGLSKTCFGDDALHLAVNFVD